MLSRPRTLMLLVVATYGAAAQCPVDTIIVKGRVENAPPDAKVQVRLVYAKDKPGESVQTTVADGNFRMSVEFLTQSSRPLLANLKPKCERKPRSVVFTLFEGDQQRDELTLDFPHDFRMTDPTAYSPQSDVVLKSR